MIPFRKTAERALSVEMLIPLLHNKAVVLVCKLLGLSQLADLEPMGLAQLHLPLDVEDGFPATIPNVNVYGSVVVTVKKESIAVLFEYPRHGTSLPKRQGVPAVLLNRLVRFPLCLGCGAVESSAGSS